MRFLLTGTDNCCRVKAPPVIPAGGKILYVTQLRLEQQRRTSCHGKEQERSRFLTTE